MINVPAKRYFKLISSLQVIQDLLADHLGFSLILINKQQTEVTMPSNCPDLCFGSAAKFQECASCYQDALRCFIENGKDEMFFVCPKKINAYVLTTSIIINYDPVYLMARLMPGQEVLSHQTPFLQALTKLPINIVESDFTKTQNIPYGMSRREYIILSSLAKGHSNKEISDELHISVSTVKLHVSNIFKKLKVENRAEAVSVATSSILF